MLTQNLLDENGMTMDVEQEPINSAVIDGMQYFDV